MRKRYIERKSHNLQTQLPSPSTFVPLPPSPIFIPLSFPPTISLNLFLWGLWLQSTTARHHPYLLSLLPSAQSPQYCINTTNRVAPCFLSILINLLGKKKLRFAMTSRRGAVLYVCISGICMHVSYTYIHMICI